MHSTIPLAWMSRLITFLIKTNLIQPGLERNERIEAKTLSCSMTIARQLLFLLRKGRRIHLLVSSRVAIALRIMDTAQPKRSHSRFALLRKGLIATLLRPWRLILSIPSCQWMQLLKRVATKTRVHLRLPLLIYCSEQLSNSHLQFQIWILLGITRQFLLSTLLCRWAPVAHLIPSKLLNKSWSSNNCSTRTCTREDRQSIKNHQPLIKAQTRRVTGPKRRILC